MRNSLLDLFNSEGVFLPVPDDILIYILSRLDVRDVIRCRFVCKRWKNLTSNLQFQELILRPLSNLPMILAQSKSRMSCIDEWWITSSSPIHKVGSGINKKPDNHYYSSLNGFILRRISMEVGYNYIVRNPMTREEIKIVLAEILPLGVSLGMIGIYLHPIRKDYYILWRFQVFSTHGDGNHIQYKMFNLGSKPVPLWRNIGRPWTHLWHEYSNPVYCLNDGFMYWLVEDNDGRRRIIAFDIKSEGLTEIPLPIKNNKNVFYPSSLVNNDDGGVSAVELYVDDTGITVKILTLKDGRFWADSEYVHYQNIWRIKSECRLFQCLTAVALANNELVFQAIVGRMYNQSIQLFVCNLQTGKLRNLKEYRAWVRFWAHRPTFASLRNCQLVINITKQEIMQSAE